LWVTGAFAWLAPVFSRTAVASGSAKTRCALPFNFGGYGCARFGLVINWTFVIQRFVTGNIALVHSAPRHASFAPDKKPYQGRLLVSLQGMENPGADGTFPVQPSTEVPPVASKSIPRFYHPTPPLFSPVSQGIPVQMWRQYAREMPMHNQKIAKCKRVCVESGGS